MRDADPYVRYSGRLTTRYNIAMTKPGRRTAFSGLLVVVIGLAVYACSSPLRPLKESIGFCLIVLPFLLIPIVGPLERRFKRAQPVPDTKRPGITESQITCIVIGMIMVAFFVVALVGRLTGFFSPGGA
jgi:hypothetical protein